MASKSTIDHREIRQWAEKYQGHPEVIDDPDAKSDLIGIRIDFPGVKDEQFLPEGETREATWQEFFKRFEDQQLSFIYEEPEQFDSESLSQAYRFMKRNQNHKDLQREVSHKQFIEELKSRD